MTNCNQLLQYVRWLLGALFEASTELEVVLLSNRVMEFAEEPHLAATIRAFPALGCAMNKMLCKSPTYPRDAVT